MTDPLFKVTITRVGRFRWQTLTTSPPITPWDIIVTRAVGVTDEPGPTFLFRWRAQRWANRWIAKRRRLHEWLDAPIVITEDVP